MTCQWKPYPPAACYWVDGIRRHVFFGRDARTCDCGGKTVVLDEQGRVIDETVTIAPSELAAMAEYFRRRREEGRC